MMIRLFGLFLADARETIDGGAKDAGRGGLHARSGSS
jgi:hypothetical protein